MSKLGVISVPQPGDFISIMTKDGKSLTGQVVNWGAEEWDERWAVCRVDDEQMIQVNIGNISTYSLQKQSSYASQYKVITHNDGETQERIITAQQEQPTGYKIVKNADEQKVVKAAPIITRRLAKTGKAVLEEGTATHRHLAMDSIERARALASQHEQRVGLHRRKVQEHMSRKDIERVKNNYEKPSFKKRSKD